MGLKRLLQTPSGTLRAVFDGDAGLGQSVANLIGLGEILGLAGFGTLLQLFGNQTVKRSMLSGIGTGSGGAAGRTLAYPRFRQRIQTKRIEHRTHIHQNSANFILRNIRINTIGKLRKQRVARTNRRENRSGGAGNINIVIHCGDEISRQLIGGNRNDLLTGRLPANGGTGTFDEIRHTIVRGLSSVNV